MNPNSVLLLTSIFSSTESKTSIPTLVNNLKGKYNKELDESTVINYGDERDDYFTDVKVVDGKYLVSGYSSYEDGSYLSKFITYSDALKVLGVE